MKTTTLITPLLLASLKTKKKEYTLHDARCEGLALRVQPSGAISWITWLRENGKTRRITLGKLAELSPDEARKKQRNAVATEAIERPALRQNYITFKELADAFVAAKRGVYAETSMDALQTYLRSQLRPNFNKLPMDRIKPAILFDWFTSYSTTSPGGANAALGFFTTIYNWGQHHDQRLIPTDLPNPAGVLRKNCRKPVGRMLNADQIDSLMRVLQAAPTIRRNAADAIMLTLLTGCRSGEILKLKWSEWRGHTLFLQSTKTGPRRVELSQSAERVLIKREVDRTTGYVFPSDWGSKPHLQQIGSSWAKMKKQAKIDPAFRLHDLRHTYASHALQSGETLQMTGKLLGHADVRSTERYAHLDETYLIKVARKVANNIDKMMG